MSELPRMLLLPVRRAADALNLPVFANPFATRRAPLHAPDFPLVLLFTEKAGCTSLAKWFLFHTGKLEEARQFSSVHDYRKRVLHARASYRWEALRLTVSRQKPIVKLVRNPFDRAVSSFFETLSSAGGKDRHPWGLKLIAAARQHAGKPASEAASLSFRDFMHYLASNGTQRGQVNGHVAQQHVAGENGRIDRIIKLERFAEEIRQLESEYGLAESPLELIIASRHHRSGFQRELASGAGADLEITAEQVRKRRGVPAYEALYDDETRRLVRQCFAVDFEAYGYDA